MRQRRAPPKPRRGRRRRGPLWRRAPGGPAGPQTGSARRHREIGRPPGWLSLPLIATSHAWENAKNEQSHQDPTLPEALLGEMADTSRVLFPIDANSAV